MSQESFKEESSKGISLSAEASYAGVYSLSGGFGMTSSNSQAAQKFLSKVVKKTISIGAPPPADGNTMTWTSTVKETPIPFEYKLENIENLFTERYMKSVDFNYGDMKKLIEDGKTSYCSYLKEKGNVNKITYIKTFRRYCHALQCIYWCLCDLKLEGASI